jgi:hypothetical protein
MLRVFTRLDLFSGRCYRSLVRPSARLFGISENVRYIKADGMSYSYVKWSAELVLYGEHTKLR